MTKISSFIVSVMTAFMALSILSEAAYAIHADVEGQSKFSSTATIPKATIPKLTAIARNDDGSIRSMNQMDAIKYCQSRGLRLPTIRELALYAQALGAEGVNENPQEGYYLVEVIDENGQADRFYYSPSGYRRPRGDLGYGLYWSSSLHMNFAGQGYALHGYHGGMVYEYQTVFGDTAVRCVLPPDTKK